MEDKKRKDVDLDEVEELDEDLDLDEISDEELEDLDEVEDTEEQSTEDGDFEDDDFDDDEEDEDSEESDEKEKDSKKDSKDDKKSKKDDKDELLEDEGESFGAKIVIAIVVIAIIIILLLKSCSGKKEQFNITFDTRGGSTVAALKVDKDGRIPKPADPTKEGYIFDGWYYNGELFDFNTKVTGDITLEARWRAGDANEAAVTGVTLNQTTLAMKPDETATLIATVQPSDAKDKSLTWESSDESIVTVDENGNIRAIKAGTATITVTTKDGGYKATATITVTKDIVPVSGVSLDKTTLNLATGSSTTLKATVKPSDATNKGLTWKSSDPSIVSVDKNGKITGKKEGTATITVTTSDGSYTATVKVTVKDQPVTSIGVSGNKTMTVGGTQTLKLTIKPSNASNKGVTWKSSNTAVATVDKNGKVTAKGTGTVTITATAKDGSGKSGSITITVKAKEVVYAITLTAEKDELNARVGYKVSVTRDKKSYTGYNGIIFSNGKAIVGNRIQTGDDYTSIKTATIVLEDGTEVKNVKVTTKN